MVPDIPLTTIAGSAHAVVAFSTPTQVIRAHKPPPSPSHDFAFHRAKSSPFSGRLARRKSGATAASTRVLCHARKIPVVGSAACPHIFSAATTALGSSAARCSDRLHIHHRQRAARRYRTAEHGDRDGRAHSPLGRHQLRAPSEAPTLYARQRFNDNRGRSPDLAPRGRHRRYRAALEHRAIPESSDRFVGGRGALDHRPYRLPANPQWRDPHPRLQTRRDHRKPFPQLTLYALALSHLTGIPLFDFKCAWFNERQYCEFFPRTILARKNAR